MSGNDQVLRTLYGVWCLFITLTRGVVLVDVNREFGGGPCDD